MQRGPDILVFFFLGPVDGRIQRSRTESETT
jgi:hypothetical protein